MKKNYELVGPAIVQRVSRAGDDETVYVVVGVRRSGEPSVVPSRQMSIRHRAKQPWQLVVDGEPHSRWPTLRLARYEASTVEFGNVK